MEAFRLIQRLKASYLKVKTQLAIYLKRCESGVIAVSGDNKNLMFLGKHSFQKRSCLVHFCIEDFSRRNKGQISLSFFILKLFLNKRATHEFYIKALELKQAIPV